MNERRDSPTTRVEVIEVEVDGGYSYEESRDAGGLEKKSLLTGSAPLSRMTGTNPVTATSGSWMSAYLSSSAVGCLVGVAAFLALLASPYGRQVDADQSQSDVFRAAAELRQDDHHNSDFVYHEQSNPSGTCILDRGQLPTRWRPPGDLKFPDSPWTPKEQRHADYASQKGLDELIDFYNTVSNERVLYLGVDAANSLVDQCYSSANKPAFHDKACKSSAQVVKLISTRLLQRADGSAHEPECKKLSRTAEVMAYANHLSKVLPGDSDLRDTRSKLVAFFKASFGKCDGLDDYMKVSQSWEADLRDANLSRASLSKYVQHSNVLNDIYTIPELDPTEEMDRFTATLWKYASQYNYTNGVDVKDGHDDAEEIRRMGFLVAHIAYIPSGYGRHAQLVQDAPWLYEFIRRNYWNAMESGSLNLFFEFIFALRQYGCTEDNDLMVRDGSRYFLHYFKELNFTWMPDTNAHNVGGDYNQILLPWAGIGALRRRQVEPIVPGSYGYGFKSALERGAAAVK